MHGIDNYKYHKYRFVHMYSRDIHLYYELLLGLAKLHEHNHLYVYILSMTYSLLYVGYKI